MYSCTLWLAPRHLTLVHSCTLWLAPRHLTLVHSCTLWLTAAQVRSRGVAACLAGTDIQSCSYMFSCSWRMALEVIQHDAEVNAEPEARLRVVARPVKASVEAATCNPAWAAATWRVAQTAVQLASQKRRGSLRSRPRNTCYLIALLGVLLLLLVVVVMVVVAVVLAVAVCCDVMAAVTRCGVVTAAATRCGVAMLMALAAAMALATIDRSSVEVMGEVVTGCVVLAAGVPVTVARICGGVHGVLAMALAMAEGDPQGGSQATRPLCNSDGPPVVQRRRDSTGARTASKRQVMASLSAC